jgi:hypothetical protein
VLSLIRPSRRNTAYPRRAAPFCLRRRITDAAAVLGVSVSTLRNWDKLGNYTAQGNGSWDATLGQTVRERK